MYKTPSRITRYEVKKFMSYQRCEHASRTRLWSWGCFRAGQLFRCGSADTVFSRTRAQLVAAALLSMLFGGCQIARAQSAQSPEYTAAKEAAELNWTNPPLSANAGKDVVGVLMRDANELNAAKALYRNSPPAVQGAVDGSLVQASGTVKIIASNIVTAHHCELTPVPATADPLTRAASEINDASICLGGQPAETLGHKIANNGDIRALEREATLGLFGHGDKQAAIARRMDPRNAGVIDFAVQQIINNFSKNDIAAEIARERQASTQPQPRGPSAAPPPAPASPTSAQPSSHPASTVVDLPPAGPGYAPMHASAPAMDGCWWAPFVSERFDLEAAVSHCETDGWAAVAGETDTGITLTSPGSSSPPEQVLTVETKRADQTIEAAIQQQFIAKLKIAAARLSCHPRCQTEGGTTSCTVVATGAYSKLKKFNQDDDSSEDPCPGLMTTDAISVYFLYRPAESKTKFLLFSADDLGGCLNDATIHFRSKQ